MVKSFRDKLVEELPPSLREGVQRRVAGDEAPPKIRKFHLNRERDESGVSGTGIVAVGVVLPSGRAIIEWVSKRTKADSLGIYDDVEDVEMVHGHGGATKIVFDEE
jgi:hypothetical protein